ncbi:MAG: HAD-IA family hydrolase [Candidatus Omnitrophica bacterium]|nr:HAD-IA family hydrolase [Candidatus Omnitrophota bacterium]
MPKERVDTILFDLDGTLVDSRKDIVAAVNHTLREMGREEKPFELVVSYIGTGSTDLVRKALEDDSDEAVSEGLSIFTRYFGEHFADNTRLFPNVRETLSHFGDKRMMLVTNRRTELTRSTLDKFGLSGFFSEIRGGDDDACLKPTGCPITKVLSGAGEKAIMVGDMDLDILSGKEAGTLTCGVTYGLGSRKDLRKAGADFVIDDILELKDIIE